MKESTNDQLFFEWWLFGLFVDWFVGRLMEKTLSLSYTLSTSRAKSLRRHVKLYTVHSVTLIFFLSFLTPV